MHFPPSGRMERDVPFGAMACTAETALTILEALTEARSAGRVPSVIILDEATQANLQELHIGCWAAGPATWSLFGVPVVTGLRRGWGLRLVPDAEAEAA